MLGSDVDVMVAQISSTNNFACHSSSHNHKPFGKCSYHFRVAEGTKHRKLYTSPSYLVDRAAVGCIRLALACMSLAFEDGLRHRFCLPRSVVLLPPTETSISHFLRSLLQRVLAVPFGIWKEA
jgi:hypothetical protein